VGLDHHQDVAAAQEDGVDVGEVEPRKDLPMVGPDSPALTAARLIAGRRLPGIAVVDVGATRLRCCRRRRCCGTDKVLRY
jgi:CBS domain-containing protein